MKLLYITPIIVWLVTISITSFSQTRTINGTVTDDKHEPVIGATVAVKDQSIATFTDGSGKFSLLLKDSIATLIVKYLGYKSQEIILKKEMITVNVVLEEEAISLDEVVVTGIGITSSKRALSYSVTDYSGKVAGIMDMGTHSKDVAVYTKPNAKAGVLTAGEINDFGKWILWKDIESGSLKEYSAKWGIHPEERYCLQLVTENGMPVINAAVSLVSDTGEIYWTSRTDNTGKAELWKNIYSSGIQKKSNLTINVTASGRHFQIRTPKEFHSGVNMLKVPLDCTAPKAVDIAFVVDGTGSMQDEIDYLKAELDNIITRINDSLDEKNLNLGCVFYRDQGDAYLTLPSDLSSNISTTLDFIRKNNADGGGDFPEAVHEALSTAMHHLSWREDATARIIFLILDAPPHEDSSVKTQLRELIREASMKGIRVVPVTCSGIDKSTEYLLRSVALATNGTYVFLTDDSGIGVEHIKPTTDKYDVELLNDVLFRVIYNFSHTEKCEQPAFTASIDTLIILNDGAITQVDADLKDVSAESRNIAEVKSQLVSWKYFPNPTHGITYVEVQGKMKEIFVTDLSGKIMLRREVNNEHSFEIDLTEFAAGTYFLMCESEEQKILKGKVVLIH